MGLVTYPPQQPSLPPPQDPYVSYPPTQPYTDPYGQAGFAPGHQQNQGYQGYEHTSGQQPSVLVEPPVRPLWPWLAVVVVLSLALVAGGGWVLYDRVLREDTGVAACKAMAGHEKTESASGSSSSDEKLTRDDYVRMRKVFADSRYADLREHGTKLMDILWQVSQLGADDEAVAMNYLQPLTEHVSGLQSACADHGVIINLKITD